MILPFSYCQLITKTLSIHIFQIWFWLEPSKVFHKGWSPELDSSLTTVPPLIVCNGWHAFSFPETNWEGILSWIVGLSQIKTILQSVQWQTLKSISYTKFYELMFHSTLKSLSELPSSWFLPRLGKACASSFSTLCPWYWNVSLFLFKVLSCNLSTLVICFYESELGSSPLQNVYGSTKKGRIMTCFLSF